MIPEIAYIGHCRHGQVVAIASRSNLTEMTAAVGKFLESDWIVQIVSPANPIPGQVSCLQCASEKEPAA